MTVFASFATSLEGFIADPDGRVGPLFDWYDNGEVEVPLPGPARPGAFVCGRGVFDYTSGWGGRPPGGYPTFVVTHRAPPENRRPSEDGVPYTFVHDGIPSAVRQAKAVAGGGNIGLSGASVAQQALNAGLLDEVGIDLVPVFLGRGIRYFENIGPAVRLDGPVQVVEGKRVTHLRYLVRH